MDVGTKLLLVDDDEMLADALRRSAAEAGFEVLVADNGRAALEIAAAERPDAILLDVMLPELDGRDVLALLRKNESMDTTVIVVMSGRAEQHERLVALELGADDFEEKPMLAPVLMAKIRHLIRKRRSQPLGACA